MKKYYFLGLALCIALLSFSQNNTINYKALVKDNLGNPLISQNIDIRFTIFSGASQVYQETHNTNTDANGIAIVNIGAGTTSDIFTNINWNGDPTSLRVEIDSGSGFNNLGTTEFKSVPYALDSPGLKKVTEGANTGWQLFTEFTPDGAGRAPIGDKALDLSEPIDSGWDFMGASGFNSFAANANNWASGNRSAAFGDGNQASGFVSAAFGEGNWVSGNWSLIGGLLNESGGDYSVTFGQENINSGNGSLTIGSSNNVSGNNSQASGSNLLVSSSNALAVGSYNVDNPNTLFVVGNGTFSNRSNALSILQDGSSTINGELTVNNVFAGNINAVNGIKAHPAGTFTDAQGVYGENIVDDFYGIGIQGRGGYIGVFGDVDGTGSFSYYGLYGGSISNNTGVNYGVYGVAAGGATNYSVYAAGDLAHTGALINASDRKLKSNIQSLTGALDAIEQLNPTSYSIKPSYVKTMNMSSGTQMGFIAQEIQRVFPNLVTENVHPGASKNDPSIEYLGVNYIGLIPVLTAGIKEQQQIIEQQQQTIEAQQTLLQDLLRRVEALENRD